MPPDAYEEFLELPPGPRPPHHYALLAIPLFESDKAVIHDAGLNQNAKVRRWALHPDREKSDAVQDLLNKLGRATFDLEDPQRKAEYDRKLAAELGVPLPGPPVAVRPPAPPAPPPPFVVRPSGRSSEGYGLKPALRTPPGPPAPPRSAAVIPGPRPASVPAPAARVCPACNTPVGPGDAFCSACGEELGVEEEPLSIAARARRRRRARALTRAALLAGASLGALLLYFGFRGSETPLPPVQPGPTESQVPPGPPPLVPKPPVPPTPAPTFQVYKAWPFDGKEAKRRQDETARALGVQVEEEVDLGGGVRLTLVLIPAGEFLMGGGQPNGDPHRVTIGKPFWMGKYEITQDQWDALMGQNMSRFPGAHNPVETASWNDVQGFLQELNSRAGGGLFALPTEAQWVYACRAGTSTRFSFGDEETELGAYAWYRDNSRDMTHPVGLKTGNAWGLFDMHGNVEEWLASPYVAKHDGSEQMGAEADGRERATSSASFRLPAKSCGIESRCMWDAEFRFEFLGFRVARAAGKGSEATGPPKVDPAGPIIAQVEKAVSAKDSAKAEAGLAELEGVDPGNPRLPELRAGVAAIRPGPAPAFRVYADWPFDAAGAKRRQEETARALGVKAEEDVNLAAGVKLTLVLVPAGEFMMGSPRDEPCRITNEGLHRVTIGKPFWIGQCEVSQEQWEAVMGNNPSRFKGARNPVESVSWNDIQGFLQKLNGRAGAGGFALPTEAQWEYACRAGTSTRFCSGDEEAGLGAYAWHGINGKQTTHPVGQKSSNAWGLNDMLGNVWEWCASPYVWRYDWSEQKGAGAAGRLRVLRGGSWGYVPRFFCRSAYRSSRVAGGRRDDYGFRVLRAASAVPTVLRPPADVAGPIIARVQDAILLKDYPKAKAALDELKKAEPDHARLPELEAQVAALAPKPGPAFQVYKEWPFGPAEAKRRQEETARALGVQVEEDVDLGGRVKLTLVLIPAGEFMMGSPQGEKERFLDEDLHQVTIGKPFYVGKHEVTQEQWEAVTGTNPSLFKGTKNPVEAVSWNEVQGFLAKLNARAGGGFALPTEAQWEYACRAGTATRFCSGDDNQTLDDYAWYLGNSGKGTHPVGGKKANGWGLHDMHGNAWELCGSPFSFRYDGSEQNCAETDADHRVLRGGSWTFHPWLCRSANRFRYLPAFRPVLFGFRVVRAARTF